MKLLGVLGINWKILVIQSLNFLVLFLILKWLFFKPFIEAIKKEKLLEDRLEKEKRKLALEKKEWQKEREKELLEAREKVERLIFEAEKISKKIKDSALKQSIEIQKKAIDEIKKRSEGMLEEYKGKLAQAYRQKALGEMLELFRSTLPCEIAEKMQEAFWSNFLKKVKLIDLEDLALSKSSEFYEVKNKEEKSKLKEILKRERNKVNFLIKVWSAFPLKKWQETQLLNYFQRAYPWLFFRLVNKEDVDLISGYRLEVGGFLVEENLKEKIEKIFR